jgi:hypothetical protein
LSRIRKALEPPGGTIVVVQQDQHVAGRDREAQIVCRRKTSIGVVEHHANVEYRTATSRRNAAEPSVDPLSTTISS